MPPLSARGYLAALPAAINRELRERSYRAYVTDSFRAILTAFSALSQSGPVPISRWIDKVEERGSAVETRAPEEVIADIRQRLKEVSG